ncbi:MAG TPA: hypothetical protein VN840_20555 [Streptosporangiaceae bacterium]|nr:hypothetical protein [Streptosporangiaceae bacterium]
MNHVLAISTIRLSATTDLMDYVAVWVICIGAIAVMVTVSRRSKHFDRWTTRDVLVIAALAVLLEVYDNIIGDQFLKPIINTIPGAELLQVHDLPYMFLFMVGVAMIRKPGVCTAMVFINFLLAQLLFGAGHWVLDWTDGLTQGVFCDLYLIARRGRVLAGGSRFWVMAIDGLILGVLRGGPNAFLTDWVFDPYLNATYYTGLQVFQDTFWNALGNGVEAAISAALALRVAGSVLPVAWQGGSAQQEAPFDPDDEGVPEPAGRRSGEKLEE